MYCPKCGGQNSDDLAYCRECGENLNIISQVMKRHLSVALISKLDAAIDRKNERLRRDYIVNGISGIICIIATLVYGPLFVITSESILLQTLATVLLPAACFSVSGWRFLSYQRSLELAKMRARSTGSAVEDKSYGETAPILADSSEGQVDDSSSGNSIYCSECGRQNADSTQFCRSCGFSLNFGPAGFEKYLPAFVIRKLDSGIVANEEFRPTYDTKVRFVLLPLITIFGAVMGVVTGNTLLVFLNIFIALNTFIISGWDILSDRRTNMEEFVVPSGSRPSFFQEIGFYFADSYQRRKIIHMAALALILIFGAFLLSLVGVWPRETAWILAAIVPVMMVFRIVLNFLQFRTKLLRVISLEDHESETRELPLPDTSRLDISMQDTRNLPVGDDPLLFDAEHTRPLEPARLSVTEQTTKPLPSGAKVFDDEAPTTQKLDEDLK